MENLLANSILFPKYLVFHMKGSIAKSAARQNQNVRKDKLGCEFALQSSDHNSLSFVFLIRDYHVRWEWFVGYELFMARRPVAP